MPNSSWDPDVITELEFDADDVIDILKKCTLAKAGGRSAHGTAVNCTQIAHKSHTNRTKNRTQIARAIARTYIDRTQIARAMPPLWLGSILARWRAEPFLLCS